MAKSSAQRIYVDACCFTEVASYREGVHKDLRELDILFTHALLRAALAKDVELITSTLAIAECQYAGDSNNKILTDEVKRLYRAILCSNSIVLLAQPTISIAEEARDLYWNHDLSLKGADALHVATAIDKKCKCVEFLTYDNRISTQTTKTVLLEKYGLSIIRPNETRVLPNKYMTEGGGLLGGTLEQRMQTVYGDPSFVETSFAASPEDQNSK